MATKYFIFEQYSQTTLKGSQTLRSTNGFEALTTIQAESETDALAKWLSDKQDSYDIIMADDIDVEFQSRKLNAWYECASERMVWEPGDTSADFGDFYVNVYEESEVLEDANRTLAAVKAGLMAEPEKEYFL